MTQILQDTWNSVLNLPEDKQDLIAYIIIEEINDDYIWDDKISKSHEKFSRIANNAREDIKAGRVQEKGFGDL